MYVSCVIIYKTVEVRHGQELNTPGSLNTCRFHKYLLQCILIICCNCLILWGGWIKTLLETSRFASSNILHWILCSPNIPIIVGTSTTILLRLLLESSVQLYQSYSNLIVHTTQIFMKGRINRSLKLIFTKFSETLKLPLSKICLNGNKCNFWTSLKFSFSVNNRTTYESWNTTSASRLCTILNNLGHISQAT